MRNFADNLDQIEEKKKDCDLIEAVKSLDNASNEAFFPIVQKIILATTFKLPEIRKTALPGTEGEIQLMFAQEVLSTRFSKFCPCANPHCSKKKSEKTTATVSDSQLGKKPHDKSELSWFSTLFPKAILCSIERHLKIGVIYSMTDLGNTIILLLKTLKLRDYACRDGEIDQITQILLQPLMKIIIDASVTIPTAVSSAYAGRLCPL